MLIILLDNALKFTPDGECVSVHAQLAPDKPGFVLVEVRDTGCGISEESASRLFDRLYQAPGTILASRRGLGLGLHICRELVTRHGGEIWATPGTNGGSTFSFTLPLISLESILAPMLSEGQWPADTASVVLIEAPILPNTSVAQQEEYRHEQLALLTRCLLPDVDVLLPTVRVGCCDRYVVLAFAHSAGIEVLANRIRGQFARRVQKDGRRVSVTHHAVPTFSNDYSSTAAEKLSGMALSLDTYLQSPFTTSGQLS